MKPDKQHLFDDLLADDRQSRRQATLLAGGRILRRRRQWRAVSRAFPVALLLLATGLWFAKTSAPNPPKPAPLLAQAVKPSTGPQVLTDEQLLALFPNTPVALVTLRDGKKRLFFLCPSDDQKYAIHL